MLLAEKMIYDEISSTSIIEQKGFDGTIELKSEKGKENGLWFFVLCSLIIENFL